ncbi:hypothetical protein DCAR_0206925 [Daucus carota subsp. sativus]|uniref:Uncharacterized protein n=1 Tax=Daucus carota subsp. sativus TaxID=79200 RepID=A0AAF0WDP0_DAUCS|nr:hypothetical protein DCAR_0206925 [Daucus carota subsp. sativus]
MIYRKWSLLTGPPAIAGAVVGSVVVFQLLFGKSNKCLPFLNTGYV